MSDDDCIEVKLRSSAHVGPGVEVIVEGLEIESSTRRALSGIAPELAPGDGAR